MKRVALHTLGCKLNYAETAMIGKQFTSKGYTIVDIDSPADVIVINTCSVTERSDRECRQLIRRALRHSPDAFVAVVGCYTQLQPEEITRINGVDLVLGTQDKFSLFKFIDGEKKKLHPEINISCIDKYTAFIPASSVGFHDRTRAFLKAQDGCDYNCSFCTVPLARGRNRSSDISTLLTQAREACEQGYKEIVITGVNIGEYGNDKGENLLSLLKQLVTIDGLLRIRVSSIEANVLTDELLDFWFAEEKLCKHWHIPLQSGCNEILKSMRRRYSREHYAHRIEQIKSVLPDAGIGADIITGFPGETKKLFTDGYKFVEDLPLSYLHVFSYSKRPQTLAATFNNQIEPRIKAERSKRLRQLGVQKKHMFYRRFVGKSVPVLLESLHPNGTISGLTGEYVRVDLKDGRNLVNEIVQVKIIDVTSDRCLGIHEKESIQLTN